MRNSVKHQFIMVGIPTLLFCILAVSVSFTEGVVKLEKRIIGGEDVSSHEFPHQLFLFKQQKGGGSLSCGGSLLTPEWVLTAAHCVSEFQPGLVSIHIFAGTDKNPFPVGSGQLSEAKEVFPHPCFLGDFKISTHNDIALIKLATPFFLDENVKTIQIDETNRAKPDTQTTAIGWGRTDSNTQDTAQVLKKASIPLPAAGFCGDLVPNIDVGSQQCSIAEVAICDGDSGGPLLCKDGGVNFVCGISSFARDDKCIGNVFVRVFHYRNWIKEVMTTSCNSEMDCVVSKVNGGQRPTKTIERCVPIVKTETSTEASINANTDTTSTDTREDTSKTNSRATTLYGQALGELFIGMILISFPHIYETILCQQDLI